MTAKASMSLTDPVYNIGDMCTRKCFMLPVCPPATNLALYLFWLSKVYLIAGTERAVNIFALSGSYSFRITLNVPPGIKNFFPCV